MIANKGFSYECLLISLASNRFVLSSLTTESKLLLSSVLIEGFLILTPRDGNANASSSFSTLSDCRIVRISFYILISHGEFAIT